MIATNFNTQVMPCFLHEISQQLSTKDHAVIILDLAGYHRAKTLALLENITLLYLPPHSPELNHIEQLWHYLRSHYWSNKYYADYDSLEEEAIRSWRAVCLLPEKVKSICRVGYIGNF